MAPVVKSSRAASLGLAGVLLLSLFGKLLAARPDPSPDPIRTADALAQVLAQSQYETRIVRTRGAPGQLVEAWSGDCRLLAGDYPPYDTFADVYGMLARPLGSLRYVYRGSLVTKPPKFRALFDFYLWREMRRIGLPQRRAPVIAIAATPACDLTRIDWRQTATLDL